MAFKIVFLLLFVIFACKQHPKVDDIKNQVKTSKFTDSDSIFLSYIVNPKVNKIDLYWKNDEGKYYNNANKLKNQLLKQNKELLFSVNGGMYLKNRHPQGLYIEKGVLIKQKDTIQNAYGNFYMQPNGVFYITDSNKVHVCETTTFSSGNVKYATQSGPMLLIDGKIHPKFNKKSTSKFVRNGVGKLPNGNILFVMSKQTINFYDFANFFKNKGCKNALYLDGFVSRTYLPSQNWTQLDGEFGVMIAVSKTLE